jgi:hypothetical protein
MHEKRFFSEVRSVPVSKNPLSLERERVLVMENFYAAAGFHILSPCIAHLINSHKA